MKYKLLIFLLCLFPSVFVGDIFLENWMGVISPLYNEQTLYDIRLPATHDSLSYDLSNIISNGSLDNQPGISDFLHYLSKHNITPNEWIREQSTTQSLNIT